MFSHKLNGVLYFIILLALATSVGMAFYYDPLLPEQIPHHFGFTGEADSWGGKYIIGLEPGLGAVFYLLFLLVRKKPQWLNFPWKIDARNREVQYALGISLLHWVIAECMLLFVYLQKMTIRVAFQPDLKLGWGIWFFLIILLATTGYYTYYAYQRR